MKDTSPSENHAPNQPLRNRRWKNRLLVVCVILTGCAIPARQLGSATPDYQPDNVFVYPAVLPADLKRVAVLPLACEEANSDLTDGCETLNSILQAQLIKTKKFELVPVNPEILRNRTSRTAWTGTEVLPPDFFDSLRRVYGCDAVLFCQLTVFRAYAPLAVGWRLKLVDIHTRQTLWAVDEIFDAGQKSVSSGARHYQLAPRRLWTDTLFRADSPDDWSMRNSPRQFGEYAVAQLLATMPNR
jgi:hypothetical protein